MTLDELYSYKNEEGYIQCDILAKWNETVVSFDATVCYKDGKTETYSGIKGIVTAKQNLTIKYHDTSQNVRIKLEDVKGIEISNYKLVYPNRD